MRRIMLFLFSIIFTIICVSAGAEPITLSNVTPSAFDDSGIYVSPLDSYNRPGAAIAIISQSSIDSERRQDISMFSPVGFQTRQYDFIDGGVLYNRCHLIGAQLASGTAVIENLVTGTRYLNVEEMLPIENQIISYVKRTGDHVLYRVTPIYQGSELLPRTIEMTMYSMESDGLRMTVYCYNVQPGIDIDYATGNSSIMKCGP